MGTAIIRHKPEQNKFVQFCDFCGADEKEAKLLIESPNGHHICDSCVNICSEVVDEKRKLEGGDE